MKKISTMLSYRQMAVLISGLLLFLANTNVNAQNYGIRDDDGVNLPTVTYWYTGSEVDSTVQGAGFEGTEFGVVSAFIFKGAAIKTWKSGAGDVTGAQFNYKVWATGDSEPENYTVRNIGWSTNEGNGNQIWGSFGDQIDVASGLDAGIYNVKILFSISGTGIPGITEDGPYSATFEIPSVSSAAEILSFVVPEQVVAAQINSAEGTVELGMPGGADVSALTPTIQISDGAMIDPESGVPQDFSSDVTYTVTAEDNSTTKVWTVSVMFYEPDYGILDDVSTNLPTLSFMHTGITESVTEYGSDFSGTDFGELSTFSFTGASIKIWKTGSGDVYNTHFNYKVWLDSEAEPAEYTTHDVGWSSDDSTGYQTWAGFGSAIEITNGLDAGTYNLKILFSISGTGVPGMTEDGPYTASFTIPSVSSAAEIISFEIPGQAGSAIINSSAATVEAEVLPGTELSSLIPEIGISDGATIDPESGVAQDFTSPVTYTVTAEDLSTKIWTVTVLTAEPNYGIRDDDGVNLPSLTYWYTDQAEDITEQGADFGGQDIGNIQSYFLKGAAIKTWKAGDGDVTGAQFNYKVWASDGTEPAEYSVRNVNWTSNDGDGNQTWSDFGDDIDITSGLTPGTYNIKVLFSISGTGVAGVTENGPFIQTFTLEASNNVAQIDARYISFGVNDAQQTVAASSFNGFDFGIVDVTTGLWLYGGGLNTFESGDYNFIGANMYYRVYEIGDVGGTYNNVELPFVEELPTPGEEVWEQLTLNVDLLTELTNGDYYFDVYFEAKYTTSEEGDTITIVEDNAGSNFVANFSYDDGSGFDQPDSKKVTVYPNPAVGMFNVVWTNQQEYHTFYLFSVDGKMIASDAVDGECETFIDVSGIEQGMYFIKLTGDKNNFSQKIIIEQ